MADSSEFVTDYPMSIPAMEALGWRVDPVVWDDPTVDWDAYDVAYICIPWDYTEKIQEFLKVLDTIDRSAAHLFNDRALVHWNLEKTYLREIEERGGDIVPSIWRDEFDASTITNSFSRFATDKIVIKPQVGANAEYAFVLADPIPANTIDELAATFASKPHFVQPFIESVRTEGEYSLFYFGSEYSHAILKVPAEGDFRSQEEHGADILPFEAPAELRDAGDRVMRLVEPAPVYARADFVRDDRGRFLLMELELIEPSLYFRTDADSPQRFAAAIDQRFQELASPR